MLLSGVPSFSNFPYNITQHPFPSVFSNMSNDALVAASKTSSTPSPLRLEHSRYLRAPMSLAACSPSVGVTKRCDLFRISSIATGSSRRSFFKPTSIIGTSGHRSCASTTHYSGAVSKLPQSGTSGVLRRGGGRGWVCCTTAAHDSGVRPQQRLAASRKPFWVDRVTGIRDCVPTLCLTLSSESGVSTEKPIRMTCALE
jgi:hypothetical protein